MSQSMTISVPLRGAFFRREGKLLLSLLPIGFPLVLEPEPDNPHDPGAIRAAARLSSLSEGVRAAFAAQLPDFGLDPEEVLGPDGPETIHLAYVGREFTDEVRPFLAGPHEVRLALDPAGKPYAEVSASWPESV